MARTVGSDGAKTDEAIRAAAINLIATHGFAAVTLRDLAKQVGIQAGSLYRYYPSKNDLLLAIMVAHLEDVLAKCLDQQPASDDPLERLYGFIEFHVRYHAMKQKEVFIASMELRSLTSEHYPIVARLREEYENVLKSILQAGVARGRFSIIDVQVATFAILAMLTGLTAWYREGGRLSKDDLVRCYVDLVSNGVKCSKAN